MLTISSALSQPVFGENYRHNYESDYENIEGSSLKGIEVSLFSLRISLDEYETNVTEVCDTHFQYKVLSISENGTMTVYISPKEYCRVNGGMMYTSAGSILSDLVSSGFLVKSFRTIE